VRARVAAAALGVALALGGCHCGAKGSGADTGAAGADPEALRAIAELEAARAPAEKLAELARHPDPEVRARAVLALGRLRRADAVAGLLAALGDVEPAVRATAAFGCGLLGDAMTRAVENALLTRYAAEAPDAADALGAPGAADGKRAVRLAVLEALGRAGTPAGALSLLGGALGDPDARVRARAALALGVYAYRGNRADRDTVTRLRDATRDPDRDVRFGSVYALMRLKEVGAVEPMGAALADVDPEVRATAARALGDALAAGAPEDEGTVRALRAGTSDADWRVRVEAMRALGKGAGPLAGAAYDDGLETLWNNVSSSHMELVGAKMHAVLAGLEAGERFFAPATRAAWTPAAVGHVLELSDLSDAVLDYQEKELLSIDLANCAAAYLHDLGAGKPEKVPACGSKAYPAWRRLVLEAKLWGVLAGPAAKPAAAVIDGALDRLRALAAHDDARVRTAAVGALGDLKVTAARVALRERLVDTDIAVLSAAAEGITAAAKDGAIDALAAPAVLAAYARLDSATDFEAQVALLAALGALKTATPEARALFAAAAADPNTAVREAALAAHLAATGTALPPPPPALPAPFRPETPAPASAAAGGASAPASAPTPPPDPATFDAVVPGTRAVLKTTKGEIELELLPDVAPLTAKNFLGLAKAKFYDGNVIHRVVPNFVVQMGCPRGDGWGGPGWYIPDEINPLPFVRGAVGMALAGKDTGGSQFFIMHAYHPHLDGRFTVFARVVRGLEVADMLEVGDRIAGIDVHVPGETLPAPAPGK